jgi:hypothetical protein
MLAVRAARFFVLGSCSEPNLNTNREPRTQKSEQKDV